MDRKREIFRAYNSSSGNMEDQQNKACTDLCHSNDQSFRNQIEYALLAKLNTALYQRGLQTEVEPACVDLISLALKFYLQSVVRIVCAKSDVIQEHLRGIQSKRIFLLKHTRQRASYSIEHLDECLKLYLKLIPQKAADRKFREKLKTKLLLKYS